MQTGPGTTGKTLAARGVVDGRIAAGHFSSPQWTDTRQDTGGATKAALTTVARYRAGVRPEWAKDDAGSEEEEDEEEAPAQAAPAIERRPDDRLGRLAARERDVKGPEVVRRRRERDDSDEEEREVERPAPSGRARAQQEDEEEEDEEAIERRRELARLRRKQMEEQEELAKMENEEDEEEESSEYETDSDDEDQGPALRLIKPTFVPKNKRETIDDEALRAEEEALQRAEQEKLQRKAASKAAASSLIQREATVKAVEADQEPSDVDTDDEKYAAEEYEGWSVRERNRIRADREARETAAQEREELERVRLMSEEERRAWERANPKQEVAKKEKAKYKFMQKYYHKGAFFQEAPDDKFGTVGRFEIYNRDFSEATGEDKFDKQILPKVMQLRKGQFGRAGRTKWTHLADQDTTIAAKKEGDDFYSLDRGIREKYESKMAGVNQPLEKPRTLKR